jgi:hypothetical protein
MFGPLRMAIEGVLFHSRLELTRGTQATTSKLVESLFQNYEIRHIDTDVMATIISYGVGILLAEEHGKETWS